MPDLEKKEPASNLPDEVTKVLEDIKLKLENVPPTPKDEEPRTEVPPIDQERESLKKTLGFSEEQMRAHERVVARQQGPLVENQGWDKLNRKSDIDSLRKDVEKELSMYPQDKRTPDLMEKVYFMVKGRKSDSQPAVKEPAKKPAERITRGPGYREDPGISPDRASGEGSSEETLSEAEEFVLGKLAAASPVEITAKDYLKSKQAGKEIRNLRVPDTRPVQSLADIELRRLTGKR